MLSKSFKSGKCKTSLKLAASRIKLLKNKRDIQVKLLRRELAQLLANGQEQTARIRVEHVIREEKTMSAYDLIEIYCELIVARLPIIESQKSCPIDLKEAISSVIFASPRCADIPELLDARKHFVAKYGKEFATSALELRPDCGVSRLIVEKLSAQAPDTETKIKILTAIAKEHDVKWDPKAFEELQKPREDLLNGSSSFIRSNKVPVESLNDTVSPVATQKETTSKILHNEQFSKPTSFNSTSHTNLRASTSPVPPTRNESMTSDRKARGSYSSQGTTSNEPAWPMEFKDAASAAQVAADSAERASMAARAAVELAGRGNMSRQNSNDPAMHSNIGNTKPRRVSSSKLKGERSESVNMNLIKEPDKLPGDQFRGGISNPTADAMEFNTHINNVDKIGGISNPTADAMEFSTQVNNVDKIDGFGDSFSMKELVGSKKKYDESDFTEENVNLNYDRSASPSSDGGALEEDTIWASSVGKNQTGSTHSFSDYAAPVFDEYSPEPNHSEGNLLDSFDNKKDDDVLRISPRTSHVNSIFFGDSVHESHPITEKKVLSSKFDEHNTVTFDDSDGTSSEEDDGVRRLLHEERRSGRDSGARGELHPSTTPKAKLPTENEEKDQLPIPSVGFKDSELDSVGEIDLKFGRLTGGLRNRGYNYPPYTASSMVDSSLSSKEMPGSTTSITEPTISLKEKKTFMSPVMADEDRHDYESSFNPEYGKGKGKGSGLEDTSSFGKNQFPYDRENKRASRTDVDSDGDKETRDSQSNIRNRGNANANSIIKLSRRTKGRNDVPISTEDSDTNLSQSVEEAKFIHENPNLNRKPNSSVKQPVQVNKKNKEARSNPDTAATSSGNTETSNSGGGVKLQDTKSPKASHVHPRLPDYDTLAAHFQSLRSNHR